MKSNFARDDEPGSSDREQADTESHREEEDHWRRDTEDDLSLILRSLMRRGSSTRKTHEARRRLANDDGTRAFLDAGLQLVAEELAALEHQEFDDDDGPRRPFFEWLSRKNVVERATELGPLKRTDGMFRDRWPYQGDYIEDLLAYALWERHWSLTVSNAVQSREMLSFSDDFVKAIHEVAYLDLMVLLDNPAYKISLIAAATASHDEMVQESIAATNRIVSRTWGRLYEATLNARGLRLRPGLSIEDITDMLTAFAEGIGLRIIAEENPRLIDHNKRTSLLGKAALALAVSCMDTGDGMSLEEIVNGMTPPRGDAPHSPSIPPSLED